ncbi:MAG: hypothetical protein ACOCP8_02035 [archaeon]
MNINCPFCNSSNVSRVDIKIKDKDTIFLIFNCNEEDCLKEFHRKYTFERITSDISF